MSEQEPVTNSGSKKQSESSFFWNFSSEGWDRIAVWAMLAALILFVVNVVDYFDFWPSYWYSREGGELRDLGNFGDFLGGVLTPLLTFLTFVGLLQSIHLQRKELAASEEARQEQAEYMKQQQGYIDRKDNMDKIIYMNGIVSDIAKPLIETLNYNGIMYRLRNKNLDNIGLSMLIDYFSKRFDIKYSIIFIKEMIYISGGDYFLELMVMRYIDKDISNFIRLYYEFSSIHGGICDDTTKAHLEKIVTFLDEQDRLTHPTP